MSEALADELEAINSIYGDGTLIASTSDNDIYILTLPGDSVDAGSEHEAPNTNSRPSLRLQFSPAYPDDPPIVLGTHSSGSGERGAAARDLALFRSAVGEVYEPGQVCLFDAIEKVKELLEAASAPPQTSHEDDDSGAKAGGGEADDTEGQNSNRTGNSIDTSSDDILPLSPPPPWILSDPITELKSTFIARCAVVTSPVQAAAYVQKLLASDKRVRSATHNITAWRIRGVGGASYQDCDDDGETAAGGRLLHLMQLMDLWDAMVVVTRWYGGQKLGPRRFAVINAVARDAFVKAGMVVEGPASGTKKKGHGR